MSQRYGCRHADVDRGPGKLPGSDAPRLLLVGRDPDRIASIAEGGPRSRSPSARRGSHATATKHGIDATSFSPGKYARHRAGTGIYAAASTAAGNIEFRISHLTHLDRRHGTRARATKRSRAAWVSYERFSTALRGNVNPLDFTSGTIAAPTPHPRMRLPNMAEKIHGDDAPYVRRATAS